MTQKCVLFLILSSFSKIQSDKTFLGYYVYYIGQGIFLQGLGLMHVYVWAKIMYSFTYKKKIKLLEWD